MARTEASAGALTWLDLVVLPAGIAAAAAQPLAEQGDLLRQWADHAQTAPPARRLLMANLSLTLLYRARVPLHALPDSAPPSRTLASLVDIGWSTLPESSGPAELFLALPAPARTLWLARWTVQLLPRMHQSDASLEARAAQAEATLGEALARGGEDDGLISAELAEWLIAAGRAGEAKAFISTALARSPSPRLRSLMVVACGRDANTPAESFPARCQAAIERSDAAALVALLRTEALSPTAARQRMWREAKAAEAAAVGTAHGDILAVYNALTFGAAVTARLKPDVLVAAADWVMSNAPALAPRATRLLFAVPPRLLPPQAQLPPSVAALLRLRHSTQPISASLAVTPLPSPSPPPPVNPLIVPLLAAAHPPFDLAAESVLQACASPPAFASLRADEAASVVSVLAGVVAALGLGAPDTPMPTVTYGTAAVAAAAAVAPAKDVLHAHAATLLALWRAAAMQLRKEDPSQPLPYLVEGDLAIESNRPASALSSLLKYWSALSAAFARPLPPSAVTDVSWRRAALAAAAQGLPIAGAALALFAPTPDVALAARLVAEAVGTTGGHGGGAAFAEYLTEPALIEVLYHAPGRDRAHLLSLLARPEASQHNAPAARAAFLAAKRVAFLKRLYAVCV